jgi:hypothetical protein
MARGYNVGNVPPQVAWTLVRGDTAAFKVYVTDDSKLPLIIAEWTISMKIKRPNLAKNLGVITDDATLVLTLTPAPDENDLPGEFTVSLTSEQSVLLETGDIFDIQLSQPDTVWTVAQGKVIVIEDVTD